MKKVLSTIVSIICVLNVFSIAPDMYSNIRNANFNFAKSNKKSISDQLSVNIPVALDDYFIINEDLALNDFVTLNDTLSIDGGNTWSVVLQPLHGILVLNNDGTFSYTPNADFFGNDTIKYQLCDIDGDCDTAFIFIEINAVNDGIYVVNDTVTTAEDTPILIDVTTNDMDIDGNLDFASLTIVTSPLYGITAIDTLTGIITYTPNQDFYGNDTIVYNICDDGTPLPSLCDTAYIFLTIISVNDKPFAVDDTVTTAEDTPVLIDVTANDMDIDGNLDFTNITYVTPAIHGLTSIDTTTGIITYTPNQDYNGNDTIVYSVCDDGTPLPSLCDTAYIFLTITSVNDKPVAIDDTEFTIENVALVIDALLNDTDIDANLNVGSLAIVSQPNYGLAIVDTISHTIDYSPNQNYSGNDTLTYQICDLAGDCDTASVFITITASNLIPIAIYDTVTIDEDTPSVIAVLLNDININSNFDSSSLVIVLQPNYGIANTDTLTGKISYTSNLNYYGNDTLIYQICDIFNNCDTAFVYISINPVNDTPTAINDTLTTAEDMPLTIDVLLNDSDIDGNLVANSITVVTPPDHGTASINSSTGEITYTPVLNYYGTDIIKYSVCDDGTPLPSLCNTAFILITITPVNDIGLPIANNDYGYTTTYTPLTINVLHNDLFGDIPCNCAIKKTNGAHGSVAINNNGTPTNPVDDKIVYTPNNNTYLGPDQFTYTIFDIDGDSSIASVYIDITPMYAPTITAPVNGALNQMPNPLINWTAVPSAFQYKLQISLDSLFGISQNYSTGLSAINISNLLFNSKYYCRVKAIGVNDSSGWSNISVFHTLKTVTITKPDNGSTNRPVSAYFRWNAITGIADYEYQMDTSLTFSSPLFVTSIIAANKIDAYSKQLAFGEHYYLRMRARQAQDTTDWSDVTDFWTLTDFSIMKPIDNSVKVAPVTKLQWEWVGSKFYEYAISTDSLFNNSVMHTFDTTKVVKLTSPPDTVVIVYSDTLLFGQKYFWKVRAKNQLDTSNWSAVKKFTILDKLSLISPANNAINISLTPNFKWDTVNKNGITHYILEYDNDSTFASPQSKTLPINSNQYTLISPLLYDTTYFWRMKAFNGINISDWSNTFKFRTIFGVGINTFSIDNNSVLIYPNPSFNGKINIQFESRDNQDIMIYMLNMIGQEVYSQQLSVKSGNNLFAIDFNTQENGIYFLKLQNGETTLTRKIILSK